MLQLRLHLNFLISTFLLCSSHTILAAEKATASALNPAPMLVGYQDSGDRDKARFGYLFSLIRLIMDATRAEFGDYKIETYGEKELSTQRYSMMLTEGSSINLGWAAPGSIIASSKSTVIPVDIFHGLLGYRICLINETNTNLFSDITTLAALRNIKIGQGRNWADLPIYTHNQITTVSSPTFEGLFKMLGVNRFDCLALGANEVAKIYQNRKAAFPFLAIDSNLLIYYHFPIYFYVSKQTPKLAERMALGLEKIKLSGEFNRLFVAHHAKELASLQLQKRNIVCIESPYIKSGSHCNKTIVLPDIYNMTKNVASE